jgi:crossover junction endodeoxyribonuclease RuvC
MSIPTSKFPKDLRLSKKNRTEGGVPRNPAFPRRIIGVDPGLASSGWGIIDFDNQRIRYIAHGCIKTKADRPRADRLFAVYEAFCSVLDAYDPTESAVETLYFARNVSSAIPVAEARGVLCMALAERGLVVREFTPNAIKQAVIGRGSAEKSQIQDLVRIILGLDSVPTPDHAADALGAAICAAHSPAGSYSKETAP